MTKGRLVKALVLWSAVIAVLVIAALGVTMIRHGFSVCESPSRIETFVARSARSMAVPVRAKRKKNPLPNTPENLAEARAHWADHCAICHANNGGGNTTIGQNLYPKAPDMRQPRTQNMTDGELYYTIQNGIRLSGMPAWGQAGENDEDSSVVTWYFALSVLALAHGNEEHVMGKVTSISDNSITVETTSKQSVTVELAEQTKFEKSGSPATLKDLKVGDKVVIHADASGSKLVAHEVRFGAMRGSNPCKI